MVSVPAFPVNISYLSVVPMLKHYQDNIDYRVTRTVQSQQQISISKIFAYTTQIINHRCICQQSYTYLVGYGVPYFETYLLFTYVQEDNDDAIIISIFVFYLRKTKN